MGDQGGTGMGQACVDGLCGAYSFYQTGWEHVFSFDSFPSSVALKFLGNFFLQRHRYCEMRDLVLLVRQISWKEACNTVFLSGQPLNDCCPFLFVLCFALRQNSGGICAVWEHGNGIFILKESLNNFLVLNWKKESKISIFLSLTEEGKFEPVKTLGLQAVYFHLTFKKHL